MGYPSKLARPLINLVIRELLPDRDSSLKIGVVVAYDWHIWAIVLLSLRYQVLKIYAPASFRNLLQGGKLSWYEWLPPNQAMRLSNLQDSWFLVSCSPSFSNSYGEEVSTGIVWQCWFLWVLESETSGGDMGSGN